MSKWISVAAELSDIVGFGQVDWSAVPDTPGVYVIYDRDEVIYVGMAGRDGSGSLRKRLKDHASGQIVNMFAQYLFLSRVQFLNEQRVRHPRDAKAACKNYLVERCAFRFAQARDGSEARRLEDELKRALRPVLNP